MNNLNKILRGIILIILGIILGLNSLNITNIDIFFNGWWTLFIIIPCFIRLFDNTKSKSRNIIGLIIGISLLLSSHNLISFEIIVKLILPFILVSIGLSLIFNKNNKK